MSWFWTIIFLSFAFSYTSEASNKHQKKASPAVVVGTVYCDTCFLQNSPKTNHFIEGASVAVECKDSGSSSTFRQEAKTDNHGQFKVDLPFSVSKHVKRIKGCSVKLISSNKPYCSVAATATSSRVLHLKSRKQGTHIFSAGFFTFRPLNQPEVCDQKPSINAEKLSPIANPNDPTFPPPISDPLPSDPPLLGRNLPPLPLLPNLPPLPQLPRLPTIPGIPLLPPVPKKEAASESTVKPESFGFPPNPFNPPSIFPPNPFLPPPSLIPPIFPTPPPSIFPPLLPSPPSPPSFLLPPFPGLTPSPPPPQPPTFPIPLPPFPFQPTPGFPGVPPAEVSSSSKTISP